MHGTAELVAPKLEPEAVLETVKKSLRKGRDPKGFKQAFARELHPRGP